MTTYNETKFSTTRITTDLQLFFELTQNVYTQDPDFAERWNEYLVEIVSDRLWTYSAAVMTNELGNEIYEGTLNYKDDDDEGCGDHTLREAFELFAKTSNKDHPQIWKDGEWIDEIEYETDDDEEDDSDVCVGCSKTEQTYNLENDFEPNLMTFHDKDEKTYCPICLEYGKGDGETDDEPVVRHMILEDSTLTDVNEAPDRDEYEIESYIEFDGVTDFDGAKLDGWTEITYKKKGTDENGNPKTDCEECGEVVLYDKIWQSSSRFLCEDCFKEANCCENCGEEPSCDEVPFTSRDLMRTLCVDCYKDDDCFWTRGK